LKVSSDELLHMLGMQKGLNEILTQLVELANQRGGDDNITAIVVKI